LVGNQFLDWNNRQCIAMCTAKKIKYRLVKTNLK
jgi:hypothetical protein